MRLIFFLAFLAVQTVSLSALEIVNPKIFFTAKLEDKSYEFEYHLRNSTQAVESIDSVSGGCSCVAVICDKKILNPGESATVTGSFDFQSDVGRQKKNIYIKTSIAGSDPKVPPLRNEYKAILEGEIPSPIQISKSALVWIDGDEIAGKKFTILIKNGFVVHSISVENDLKGGDGDNFVISKIDNTDQNSSEYVITPKTTDLITVSPSLRDYFCRLNISYAVESDGKKIARNERLELLLAKKPGKKYDNGSSQKN